MRETVGICVFPGSCDHGGAFVDILPAEAQGATFCEKEGASFVGKYNALLNATATCTAEEAGKMVGIDLTDKAFWKAGLDQIAKKVEAFKSLDA